MATAGQGSVASSSASSNAAIVSTAFHFRRLAWQAPVTVKVRLNHPSVASSDLNGYYLQAPRYTYLALLVPELRDCFVNILLNAKDRAELKETNWWFEYDTQEGSESSAEPSQSSLGACRWHWPLDQHHLHSQLHFPHPAPSYFQPSSTNQSATLSLILHLSDPPQTNTHPDIESAKASFVAQLKEADFVRWGNTRRITSLRRQDLEAAWEGVVGDDFDLHSRFTSKILPLPVPVPTAGASSDSSSSGPKTESVYSCRALPIKLYLPDDAPVIQEVVPPLGPDGKPTTLLQLLRMHLPLLFPGGSNPYSLAVPSMHGVLVPAEADVAWLSSCVCGADGWLRIAIRLVAEQ